jgi:hypothetical protein
MANGEIRVNVGWKFNPTSIGNPANGNVFTKIMENSADPATLVSREVIQNSVDAHRKLLEDLEENGNSQPVALTQVRVRFSFVEVAGDEKKNLVERLGLDQLLAIMDQVGDAKLNRSSTGSSRKQLASDETPLRLLVMSDFGARGLVGDIALRGKSGWYNCLMAIGNTEDKSWGAGGSYGFGKTAFISASDIPCVFAYTRTQGLDADQVTRKFGGCVYWSDHYYPERETGKELFGLGYFGNPKDLVDGIPRPFVDENADEYARILNLPVRDGSIDSLGTSLVIVAPKVDAHDVVEEIRENWWPALRDGEGRLQVEVIDYDGTNLDIPPERSQEPSEFNRAYELATSAEDAVSEFEFKKVLKNKKGEILGTLACVADPESTFSNESSNGRKGRATQIALLRAPRMVIQYYEKPNDWRKPPYVQGVFVSASREENEKVERSLTGCEPAQHDRWWPSTRRLQANLKQDFQEGAEIAFSIRAEIHASVAEFRKSLAPATVDEPTVLKDFGKLLSQIFKEAGNRPPPPGKSPVSISFLSGDPEAVEDQNSAGVYYTNEVQVGIQDNAKKPSYRLRVNWKYVEVMDEDTRGDAVPFTFINLPDGIKADDQGFVVTVRKGYPVKFAVRSTTVGDSTSVFAEPEVHILSLKDAPEAMVNHEN